MEQSPRTAKATSLTCQDGELSASLVTNTWTLRFIREQIQHHRLSFPSQVPVFPRLHRSDIQWRIVVLYFVRGWSSANIGNRYGITRERVRQILRQWVSRALLHGYIDEVPSDREYRSLLLVLATT